MNLVVGTPLYMSPEAIAVPQTVSAQSDLYALGAVAYFLLSGNPVVHTIVPASVRMRNTRPNLAPWRCAKRRKSVFERI
jgi:serine/threonine protein kinase